jgi:hypothetical protein
MLASWYARSTTSSPSLRERTFPTVRRRILRDHAVAAVIFLRAEDFSHEPNGCQYWSRLP